MQTYNTSKHTDARNGYEYNGNYQEFDDIRDWKYQEYKIGDVFKTDFEFDMELARHMVDPDEIPLNAKRFTLYQKSGSSTLIAMDDEYRILAQIKVVSDPVVEDTISPQWEKRVNEAKTENTELYRKYKVSQAIVFVCTTVALLYWVYLFFNM